MPIGVTYLGSNINLLTDDKRRLVGLAVSDPILEGARTRPPKRRRAELKAYRSGIR